MSSINTDGWFKPPPGYNPYAPTPSQPTKVQAPPPGGQPDSYGAGGPPTTTDR